MRRNNEHRARLAKVMRALAVAAFVMVAFASLGVWPLLAAESGSARKGGGWVTSAVRDGQFVTCAVVFAAAGLLLAALWRALLLMGRAQRQRPGVKDGTALIEFVLVLPIALMLVLVMLQSALLMAGNFCVHYAAYCAARSAVVQVPMDYGRNEPPNVVLADPIWSGKLARIRDAAVWAVMPVCCGRKDYPADGSTGGSDASSNTPKTTRTSTWTHRPLVWLTVPTRIST